jgi:hypothetical protein
MSKIDLFLSFTLNKMKTFLRTTLLRWVIFIGGAIALGFGNLVPRGFILDDYYFFEKLLPDQVKEDLALQGQNSQEQNNNEGSNELLSESQTSTSDLTEPDLAEIKTDIAGLSQQITDQLNQLYGEMTNQHNQLATFCQPYNNETLTGPQLSEEEAQLQAEQLKAEKVAELQAQIEALQAEMNTL